MRLKALDTMKFVTIVAAAAIGLAQAKDPYSDWHKPSKGDGMEPLELFKLVCDILTTYSTRTVPYA